MMTKSFRNWISKLFKMYFIFYSLSDFSLMHNFAWNNFVICSMNIFEKGLKRFENTTLGWRQIIYCRKCKLDFFEVTSTFRSTFLSRDLCLISMTFKILIVNLQILKLFFILKIHCPETFWWRKKICCRSLIHL